MRTLLAKILMEIAVWLYLKSDIVVYTCPYCYEPTYWRKDDTPWYKFHKPGCPA